MKITHPELFNFTVGFELECLLDPADRDRSFNYSYKFRCEVAQVVAQVGALGVDGSVGFFNFEFSSVKLPALSLLYKGSDLLRVKINKLKKMCEAATVQPLERAGLHVHVSRIGLTPQQIVNIYSFVNMHRVWFVSVWGAETYDYASYEAITPYRLEKMEHDALLAVESDEQGIRLCDCPHDRYRKCKYFAVNIHSYFPTIEFRAPRSSYNYNIMLRRIQAAIAVRAYIPQVEKPTLEGFLDFINNNKIALHYLHGFLEHKKSQK